MVHRKDDVVQDHAHAPSISCASCSFIVSKSDSYK